MRDLPPGGPARLRAALAAAGFTVAGVADLLGAVAFAALGREEVVPAERVTRGGSPLETLTRLFLLGLPVDETAAARALPLDLVVPAGIVTAAGGQVRACVDVRPYAADEVDWWVVSDVTIGRPSGPVRPDHVLGIGGASTTLAQATVRPQVGRALDLGTGCGVQALHLSRHAAQVTATDTNPRALAMARLTAALGGVDLDLRAGSLLDPVEGERFDLVVSNPPFVIGPRGRFTYRDAGFAGDDLARRLVTEIPGHLADGGWGQVLANWEHRRGVPWQERVEGWLAGTGCDAWVIERDVQDPAEYAELWLRDSGDVHGPDYRRLYDAWLDDLASRDVETVGFGIITVRRREGAATRPDIRIEEWPHAVEHPLGPHISAHFARADWLRERGDGDGPARLGAARLRLAAGVDQEQVGPPGAEHPARIVLRQRHGLRRAVQVSTVEAALAGACDGTLTVGQILDAIAALVGADPLAVRSDVLSRVRDLVAEGFLEPC